MEDAGRRDAVDRIEQRTDQRQQGHPSPPLPSLGEPLRVPGEERDRADGGQVDQTPLRPPEGDPLRGLRLRQGRSTGRRPANRSRTPLPSSTLSGGRLVPSIRPDWDSTGVGLLTIPLHKCRCAFSLLRGRRVSSPQSRSIRSRTTGPTPPCQDLTDDPTWSGPTDRLQKLPEPAGAGLSPIDLPLNLGRSPLQPQPI